MEQRRFSLLGFWERRARRILPALITVAGFTLVVGWFLLLPSDFARFGQSLLAQSVFGSNVFFWRQSGYFGPLADELPLLHTWSLAVEEQFYLLFPLSMVVISRFAFRFRRQLVLALGVASLAISIWAVQQTPGAAFYLLPSRAWELAVGAWLALQKDNLRASDTIRQVVSFLGVGLIAFSVVAFDPATPFPGIAAIWPVLGTGAVIWANGTKLTFVGQLLATRPLVFVGLISYSLYLWHWPLFVFARYVNSTAFLSFGWNLGVVSLSFTLAYLSWRFIKTPFRKRTWGPSKRSMLATAGAGLLVIGTAGFSIDRTDGIPARLPDSMLTYLVEDTLRTSSQQACDFTSVALDSVELCRFGNISLDPAVVSLGDSHAEALLPMFEGMAEADDILVMHGSNSACPPLFGVEVAGLSGCADFNERIFQQLRDLSPSHIVLTARWAFYVEGPETNGVDVLAAPRWLRDKETPSSNAEEARDVFEHHLPDTVSRLRELGAEVWIVKQVPEQLFNVPRRLALATRFGDQVDSLGRPPAENEERQRFVNAQIDAMAGDGVQIIDPASILCDENQCRVEADHHSLYRDDDHLSPFGAVWITPAFDGLIDQTRLLPATTTFTLKRDVRYADDGDPDHLMTVYTPEGQGPFPALLAVHGGNWSGGGRDMGSFQEDISDYASRGISVFSVDYHLRSLGHPSWPASIQDIVCALRHIRANAGEYDIDPRRIGAMSQSAGGHLVSLLGTIDSDDEIIAMACGDPAARIDLAIVVSYSGPANLNAFGTAQGLKHS
ncbi:MAG: SGNH hydrolase domain-containing protein [Chloroflexi bacterium]|nr:SGNH hydrolase domain-containing protein [Chloroflexota bacterium]